MAKTRKNGRVMLANTVLPSAQDRKLILGRLIQESSLRCDLYGEDAQWNRAPCGLFLGRVCLRPRLDFQGEGHDTVTD